MIERYRKWGHTVRYEHGRVIRVIEAGEAVDSGERFTVCTLHEPAELEEIDSAAVLQAASEIEGLVRPERLLLIDGIARHEFRDVSWIEKTRRLHLALTGRRERIVVDTATFDLQRIQSLAADLGRMGETHHVSGIIRFDPMVTAALLLFLRGVEIRQAAGGRDGKGIPIEAASSPWPNWYRPSYRVRPIKMPFNLFARPFGDPNIETAAEAIALLGPANPGELRLLCRGDAGVFPAAVSITAIDAIGAPEAWFPYGGGCWGAVMLATCAAVSP